MKTLITRKDYLAQPKSDLSILNSEHPLNQYYRQFVTPRVLSVVCWTIGRERIARGDYIPNREWDAIFRNNEFPLDAIELLKAAGDKLTLYSSGCILREAAREIKKWGMPESPKTPLADAIRSIKFS
jgi:hypothetical protein